MNTYVAWPYFTTVAVVLGVMSLPAFSRVEEPSDPGVTRRVHSLDGLRGILAITVAVHHLVISYKYHFDNVWGALPSNFYEQLGEVGVSLFFMVTGFLFWRRLVIDDGRTNLLRLYIGRVFRIAPMYLTVVACMFAVVAHRTGYVLHVPPHELAVQVARWLALGIGGPQIPLNGDEHANLVIAGVTWTLLYEWIFYASLIVLCFVARRKVHLAISAGAFAIFAMLTEPGRGAAGFALLFASGALAASLNLVGMSTRGNIASLVALAAIATAVRTSPTTYGHVPQIAGLAIFFAIVSSGNSLFGLLTTRAAERLGNISYSVYLGQGLAITGFYAIPAVNSWAYLSPAHFWVSAVGCCLILVSVASVAYRYIERPAIRLGKDVQLRATSTLRLGRQG